MNSDLHDDGDDSPIQGKDLNHRTPIPKDTKKRPIVDSSFRQCQNNFNFQMN